MAYECPECHRLLANKGAHRFHAAAGHPTVEAVKQRHEAKTAAFLSAFGKHAPAPLESAASRATTISNKPYAHHQKGKGGTAMPDAPAPAACPTCALAQRAVASAEKERDDALESAKKAGGFANLDAAVQHAESCTDTTCTPGRAGCVVHHHDL